MALTPGTEAGGGKKYTKVWKWTSAPLVKMKLWFSLLTGAAIELVKVYKTLIFRYRTSGGQEQWFLWGETNKVNPENALPNCLMDFQTGAKENRAKVELNVLLESKIQSWESRKSEQLEFAGQWTRWRRLWGESMTKICTGSSEVFSRELVGALLRENYPKLGIEAPKRNRGNNL